MPKERVAIGMVADAVTWWHAATLVQQLKNLKTKLQIVVFYLGTIDGPVATTFNALGARVKEISMPVPFPDSSKFWNNKRDNLLRIAGRRANTARTRRSARRSTAASTPA